MNEDNELLRQFVEEGRDAAFGELVRRRLDFVYNVALRQTHGDAHLARDVAQEVFCDLARKARGLSRRPILVNWLYTSTRFAAAQVVRRQQRWLHRQEKAHVANEILAAGAEPEWDQLRPVLDAAMQELGDTDRSAVLLRYFENRPLAEVGRRLGLAEHAAGRRVSRALDKLRLQLERRGIHSTATALGLTLTAQPVVAAPAGLAAAVAGASLAAVGSGSLLVSLALMHTTKVVFGLAAAASLTGLGLYTFSRRPPSAPAVASVPAPARRLLPMDPAPASNAPVLASAPRVAALAASGPAAPELPFVTTSAMMRDPDPRTEALTPVVNRALRGGRSYERGKNLFESTGCSLCHAFNGGAAGIGPDLTGVGGRFGTFEILRSIIEPSMTISDLYGTKIIQTRDGKTYSGKLAAQDAEEVSLIQNYLIDPATSTATWSEGAVLKIRIAEIESVVESPTSLMPAGLLDRLSEVEIADLLAYLISAGRSENKVFQRSPGE